MYEYLYHIFSNKVFMRLRNKTQLFDSGADDHYHTRLVHTLEVEAISKEIAADVFPSEVCENEVVSIALLHDVGHTPYGHAGERSLHTLLSGKENPCHILPDVCELGIKQGFKHNINSAFLYKTKFGEFDSIDPVIFDGILKHTRTSYPSDDSKLDYGFETAKNGVFSDTFIARYFHGTNFDEEYFQEEWPLTNEGKIVAMADEISAICSDFLDLVNSGCLEVTDLKNIKPFDKVDLSLSPRHIADGIKDTLISSVKKLKNDHTLSFNTFHGLISDFDSFRKQKLFSIGKLKKFDEKKGSQCKILFCYFYKNPEKMGNRILQDLCMYFRMPELKKIVVSEVSGLTPDNVIPFVKKYILNKTKDLSKSKNLQKSKNTILKIYLKTIAVFISTMTDSYADAKYRHIPLLFKVRLKLYFRFHSVPS